MNSSNPNSYKVLTSKPLYTLNFYNNAEKIINATNTWTLDKLNGKTGEQIANMVVNGEINNLVVLGKFDISPIETTNNIWINILKDHPVLNDLKNFDIFHKVLREMNNKFLNLDTRVFCKSCEAIFKEI